jgi:dCMP deaminase
MGVATAGATLYCPWFACTDCARAIIQAGITEVVGLISLRNATPARWLLNVEMAEKMLEEAGVSQRLLAGSVGVTIRFDGRDFQC